MGKYCCNPFNKQKHGKHGRSNYKKLRMVTKTIAQNAKCVNINLVPEQMEICNGCRLEIGKMFQALPAEQQLRGLEVRNIELAEGEQLNNETENREMSDEEQLVQNVEMDDIAPLPSVSFVPPRVRQVASTNFSSESSASGSSVAYINKSEIINALNKILPLIGVTPIITDNIGKSISYCRNKLDELSTKLATKVFDITAETTNTDVEGLNAQEEMLNQLKSKFDNSVDKKEKIKILSLLPQSWSARRIEATFNTTIHMALLTKKIVKESGILCTPKQRIGTNVIDNETKELVQSFYANDEISRVCPGKRDYVIVDENNIKISKQRRLLLMNLAEAYAQFKQQNIGRKIGFSLFASLRPPQCVLALNNFGTHSVCVCSYHQNVKLIFEVMKRTIGVETYRDLLKKMLCDSPNTDCYLTVCQNCPGIDAMENFLTRLVEANEVESISYRQWINEESKK